MTSRKSKIRNQKSKFGWLTLYRRQKWIALATLTCGSLMQFGTCREDSALFGLRTAFSSITLPINTLIRNFIFSFAGLI